MDESMLKRRNVGERYLYSKTYSVDGPAYGTLSSLKVHVYNKDGASEAEMWKAEDGVAGHIYTVTAHTLPDGTRKYWYVEDKKNVEQLGRMDAVTSYRHDYGSPETYVTFGKDSLQPIFEEAVMVASDNVFYAMGTDDIVAITLDLNDYKEPYRYASTPWVVSEIKGSAEHVELTKLFRFHMISDGEASNTLCKVSIQNINPDNGNI
jgi:hypothetical protein